MERLRQAFHEWARSYDLDEPSWLVLVMLLLVLAALALVPA